MLKLNKKIISLTIFFILIIFSISAVSAADEMANDTSVDYIDDANGVVSIIPSNNVSYTGDIAVTNSSSSSSNFGGVNMTTPSVELSLKPSDNNPVSSYADVLIEYGDYYLNVNTENYLLSINQGFNYNHSNDFNKYVDIIGFSRNNRLLLNVNLLNVTSHQSVELGMFDYLIDGLLKVFNSIFNMLS